MTYKLVDLFTEKVLGTYENAEQAVKAESHLDHQPGETRYAICLLYTSDAADE